MSAEDPYGWPEYWFCVLATLPGGRPGHQLLKKDPQLVINPTAKRAFKDHEILFKRKLLPCEVAIGFDNLCKLYDAGVWPKE